MFRTEHPKPQFMRENWINLNGPWQFEFDFGNSGVARELYKNEKLYSNVIEVPFCPESKLSGIEYKDFMNAVWYRREVELTKKQLEDRVILHFGAVDYFATVYVNEKKVGTHKGGSVSFSFDISDSGVSSKEISKMTGQKKENLIKLREKGYECAVKGVEGLSKYEVEIHKG